MKSKHFCFWHQSFSLPIWKAHALADGTKAFQTWKIMHFDWLYQSNANLKCKCFGRWHFKLYKSEKHALWIGAPKLCVSERQVLWMVAPKLYTYLKDQCLGWWHRSYAYLKGKSFGLWHWSCAYLKGKSFGLWAFCGTEAVHIWKASALDCGTIAICRSEKHALSLASYNKISHITVECILLHVTKTMISCHDISIFYFFTFERSHSQDRP